MKYPEEKLKDEDFRDKHGIIRSKRSSGPHYRINGKLIIPAEQLQSRLIELYEDPDYGLRGVHGFYRNL